MRWNDLTEEQKYAYWSKVMDRYENNDALIRSLPYPVYCDDLMEDNPRVLL